MVEMIIESSAVQFIECGTMFERGFMFKRIKISLLLVLSLLSVSCSAFNRTGSLAVGTAATVPASANEISRAEVGQLEEEISLLESQKLALESAAEEARLSASSQIERLYEEAAALEEAFASAEAERATLAKQFQAYKNDIEAYLGTFASEPDSSSVITDIELYKEIAYEDLVYHEADYFMDPVSISGTVITLTSGSEMDYCLILVLDEEDRYITLEMSKLIQAEQPLSLGDSVTVYGISYGLIESQIEYGETSITPGIYVDLLTVR